MRACERCGKSSKQGGTRKLLRGHYNPTTSGKKRANLQWGKDPITAKRIMVCTSCLRTLSKTRKPRVEKKEETKKPA